MPSTKIPVAVVGAGAMGAGIAQVAAQAGHRVMLHDAVDGAAVRGRSGVAHSLVGLVKRGRMTEETRADILARIEPVKDLAELASAGLVIEAIVEDLAIKRRVFERLETFVAPDCILATNTSSLSVTAIASACKRPERVAGFHFFNPAPVMKLVEVVSGVATDPTVARTLFDLARAWGKFAVTAKSTPGFIVNRVARPFYGETLRLLEEGAADPQTLDDLMTGGGGFRMGACALMDLIGHDVNYAVTRSMFDAFSGDPRYRPSLVQKELIDAGWLGRKSGRGFFRYSAADEPRGEVGAAQAAVPLDGNQRKVAGVLLRRTDGRTASAHAVAAGRPIVLFDLVADPLASPVVALARSPDMANDAFAAVVSALQEGGRRVVEIADRPGLVVMRTVAMLANEAFEASLHGVASLDEIDQAMHFGVNYPRGPAAWAREIGLAHVLSVIDHLREATGDPRYRASLALRLAVDRETIAKRTGG